MSSITPSVGRKVWFFADDKQVEPWDATVIKVHAPAHQANPSVAVNLLVIDPDNGDSIFYEHVVASTTALPYPHYRWMPYQEAQAARAALVNMPPQMGPDTASIPAAARQYVNR